LHARADDIFSEIIAATRVSLQTVSVVCPCRRRRRRTERHHLNRSFAPDCFPRGTRLRTAAVVTGRCKGFPSTPEFFFFFNDIQLLFIDVYIYYGKIIFSFHYD
jgi:hypothetical protein